MLHLADLRE